MSLRILKRLFAKIFGDRKSEFNSNNLMYYRNWNIGPTILGENKSVGMPLHPEQGEKGLWYFDIPKGTFPPEKHVHYVTCNYGSLKGKTGLRLKGVVDIPEGARVAPRTGEEYPWLLSLYLQRKNDNWTGKGKYEAYRWYANFATIMDFKGGEFEIWAPFDADWTAVFYSHANSPDGRPKFQDALDNAEAVGFVLGGGDGLGHGVFAQNSDIRFTVTSFTVE